MPWADHGACVGVDQEVFYPVHENTNRQGADRPLPAHLMAAARTGREKDRLEGALRLMPDPPDDLPDRPVSIDELLAEQEQAEARNARRREVAASRQQAADAEAAAKAELARLREAVAAAERAVIEAGEAAEAANRLDCLPADVDLEPIRERIRGVTATNQLIEAGIAKTQRAAELADRTAEYDSFTAKIEGIAATKRDALAAASLPYPGLSFSPDGDGLAIDGVALKDCSAAQQRIVACSLAMNPDAQIRLIRLEDGSLLDSAFLATLEQLADERDYQVLIELVNEDPDAQGIVFRDGEVQPRG